MRELIAKATAAGCFSKQAPASWTLQNKRASQRWKAQALLALKKKRKAKSPWREEEKESKTIFRNEHAETVASSAQRLLQMQIQTWMHSLLLVRTYQSLIMFCCCLLHTNHRLNSKRFILIPLFQEQSESRSLTETLSFLV